MQMHGAAHQSAAAWAWKARPRACSHGRNHMQSTSSFLQIACVDYRQWWWTRSCLKHLYQRLSKACRRRRNANAGVLHRSDLGFCVSLPTGDNRASMAHAATGRGSTSCNEADHRLFPAALALVFEELRRVPFGRAADFADYHDRGGLGITQKHIQHVDEIGALDRIAAD